MTSFEPGHPARLIHDRVTTLGTGVDGAIRRLSTTFEVRGLPSKLTSYDNATVGSGSVVNEVQFAYNGFAQLTKDYQSHAGSVNLSSTPKVQLTYANGSANMIRLTSLVYPNGRTLTYGYGTTNGLDDACSRVASLVDNDVSSTHLADYRFLGLGATVVVDFTQPDVKYTLVDLSGTNDPDTGDIYSGLDRFGRVKDCRWYDYGRTTDTVRLKHGYDRASNRLWREDTVATALGKNFDELYSYDRLHRLKDMQRGTLNGSHTSISAPTFAQCWSLDPTSNWRGFKEAVAGGPWTLDQARSANTVNEITGITNSVGSAWATPAHDPAGNMTTIPKPADPTSSFTAIYDAWNRQIKLVNTSNSQTVQECQYDARTFRTVRRDYSAGVLSTTRHFYYTPAWRCIEERCGSSPDTASPDRQFVWGNRYIDDLMLRDRDTDSNGSLDERRYATQDFNWNVVGLIDISGMVQERFAYDPYGTTTVLDSAFVARASSNYQWETTYCGYRWDGNSGLLAVRYRFYHPPLGSWTCRDANRPIEYLNLYEYVGSSPIIAIDPFGLKEFTGGLLQPQIYSCAEKGETLTLSFGNMKYLIKTLNSGISDQSLQIFVPQGCMGVTGCMLGRIPLGALQPAWRQHCFKTFEQAQALANVWNKNPANSPCKGAKTCSGRPASARVIGFYWNDLRPTDNPMAFDPKTGKVTWNNTIPDYDNSVRAKETMELWNEANAESTFGDVFDYGFYSEDLGTWLGANYGEQKPQSYCKAFDFPAYYKGRAGQVVYCVVCEGDEL